MIRSLLETNNGVHQKLSYVRFVFAVIPLKFARYAHLEEQILTKKLAPFFPKNSFTIYYVTLQPPIKHSAIWENQRRI